MIKRIMFRADSNLIDLARLKAKRNHTTLSQEFRKWLDQYNGPFQSKNESKDDSAGLEHHETGKTIAIE